MYKMPENINQIDLSVVVPLFNEKYSILPLYKKLKQALEALKISNEIIFINDGSTDGTSQILNHLSKIDTAIRYFKFDSNRGQHKALEKGFQEAQGQIIVTIDGDLQNDPCDISELINKLNEGFDVVCGWRYHRNDPWLKIIKSWLANFIQRRITKLQLHDIGCSMRVYRKNVVKNVILHNKHEVPLLPLILWQYTQKIVEIKINHHRRIWGQSKYGFLSSCIGISLCYIKFLLEKM